MAKSVLELAVGTGQWDAGLKKAKSALDNFTQSQGGLQQALAKDSENMRKFVGMMGQMDSSAKTAKGQMNDYKATIEQLTMQYNRMTEVQKQTIGQDYLQSIDQLKQKYQAVNEEIQEMNRSLNNVKAPDIADGVKAGGLFGGGKLDGMLQVFGGNLMTKGVELATGAVTSLISETGDMIKQGMELAKQGEGIRIAFERLGRGDLLQGLRDATHGTVTDLELMKAAVQFNDFKLPLDQLGTMLAFAQQKAKDTGQSVDYLVQSIVTGLGRKSLMILDNLGLSATEIRERMKETGDMTKAVGAIIRDQMAAAGDYVETAADRAAQANVSLQNKMEELGRKFAPVEEASNHLWTSMKIGILDIIGGPIARLLNELTEAGRQMNALRDINGDGSNGSETRSGKALRILREYSGGGRGIEGKRELYDRQVASFQNQEEKEWRKANRLRDELAGLRKKQREDGTAGNLQPLIDDTTRQLEEAVNRAKAFRIARIEYEKGAKDIIKPANVNVNTKQAEQNITSLRKQLKELEEQRKKAVKAGDQEQVESLTKQISQVKTNIGYLDPKANKTGSSTKTAQTELQENQAKINTLTQEYVKLGDESTEDARKRQEEIQKEIELLKQRNGLLGKRAEQAQGRLLTNDDIKRKAEIDMQVNTKQIEDLRRQLTEIEGVTIDPKTVTITATDEALPKLREIEGITIDDKTMTVTTETADALRALQGIEGVTIDPKTIEVNANTSEAQQKIDELKAKIAELEDKNINIKAFVESIGKPLGEGLNNTPGTLLKAPDTTIPRGGLQLSDKQMNAVQKNIDKQMKGVGNIADEWSGVASAIGAVGNAMAGIEDPAAKVLGIVAQAIATVALTFSKSLTGTVTPWDWIAAAAAGTATMISTISAIHSATGYAEGGIIKGNSYSGDNIMAIGPNGSLIGLNAGEIVLNKSQQNNLASQLQGGGMQNLNLTATIKGEQIRLTLNNNGRRTGRGEYVQSRNVR